MERTEMEKYTQKTIDSNVLIGLFLPGDRLRKRSYEVMNKLEKEKIKIFIHPLVLIETLSILKYRNGLELAVEAKKMILKSFVTDRNLGIMSEKAEKIFDKYEKVGLIDTMLIDYCLTNKLELITFDNEMNEIWKKLKFNVR